jgi:MFS family permease
VTEERSSAQTWFALRNATFCRLWFASVASGIFVSAQEVTTTWLMHDLGASSFQLSLTAAAASAPFFLFTLPAGAFADIVSRRSVIVSAVLWQGVCAGLLALGAWLEKINPATVLACIFALGIGIAFAAPVWGAVVPDIVSKEELPSAVTLGGVQQNLAGIVGPALGGFLLPLLGAPILISINALTFLVVAVVVLFSRVRQPQLSRLRESFSESFTNSLRYALNSPRMKTILLHNALFSVAVSFIPALLPVIALKELNLSAGQLGLLFTCVRIGSLAGAMIILPYLRLRVSPNGVTSIAMALLTAVLGAMVLGRQPPALMVCAAVAGVAWALAGSELWLWRDSGSCPPGCADA